MGPPSQPLPREEGRDSPEGQGKVRSEEQPGMGERRASSMSISLSSLVSSFHVPGADCHTSPHQ